MSSDPNSPAGIPKNAKRNHLPVQANDLALSKTSFQQMLMKFNNRVVNNNFIKAQTPVRKIKTEVDHDSLDLHDFNPAASSTQNFLDTPEQPVKKRKKKKRDVGETQQLLPSPFQTLEQHPAKKRKRSTIEASPTNDRISKLDSILDKFECDNKLTQSDEVPGFSKDVTSPRYETFLIQIPKSFDPKQLLGFELSLSSKLRFKYDGVKYDCVPTPCEEPATLLNKGRLNTVHPKANIVIKQHVKRKRLPNVATATNNNVAFPNDLKERHPLFGADYARNILLEEHIREKLKAAIESNERRKEKERRNQEMSSPSKLQEEEIFKLLSESSSSKKHKKSKKEEDCDDVINQMLLSKTLEIASGSGKKRKHKGVS